MKITPHIRFATINDLPQIVNIYNQAINSNIATGDIEEFTVAKRTNWFQKFDTKHYPIYIAEYKNTAIGYATLSAYRPGRKAMNTVAEISFYIDYKYHYLGVGTTLIQHCIDDCPRIKKKSLIAVLLDINKTSIKLLKKFNFKEWGHFPNIIHLKNQQCGQFVYGLHVKK